MVKEVTVTLLKLANTQTNKQTNLQGIYFIKGLTPFSTANTPQYEFFKFFVGMDQWWISLQPSSSCKSSTWSSAPQCCSAEMTTDLQRVLSWWKIWVNRWKFCVVQVDLFFFNERNGKSYWYPFAGIILQSMKWSFFWKRSARYSFIWKNCSMMKLRSFFHHVSCNLEWIHDFPPSLGFFVLSVFSPNNCVCLLLMCRFPVSLSRLHCSFR